MLRYMREMHAKIEEIAHELSGMNQATAIVMRKGLTPWDRTSHSRSHAAAENLTPGVLEHYGFGGDRNLCHLVGHVNGAANGPEAAVITAHIFPNHTGGEGLELYGLRQSDIDNPRNFLRLHKQVEKAFDSRRLTIVRHQGQLCAYLVDKSLSGTKLSGIKKPHLTFGDCHLRPLAFSNNEFPFRRLLAGHAADTFAYAQRMGWRGHEQQYEEDTRVMELASFSLDKTAQDNIRRWLLAGRAVPDQEVANAGAGAEAELEPEGEEQPPSAGGGGGRGYGEWK